MLNRDNIFKMKKNFMKHKASLLALLFLTLLNSCAKYGLLGSPATIEVVRDLKSQDQDCNVKIKIYNNMNFSAWSGVSYHLVLRDKNNVAVGDTQGIPMRYTDPGYGLVISKTIKGIRCTDIVKSQVLYFGYYPANGGGQIRIANYAVKNIIK